MSRAAALSLSVALFHASGSPTQAPERRLTIPAAQSGQPALDIRARAEVSAAWSTCGAPTGDGIAPADAEGLKRCRRARWRHGARSREVRDAATQTAWRVI